MVVSSTGDRMFQKEYENVNGTVPESRSRCITRVSYELGFDSDSKFKQVS